MTNRNFIISHETDAFFLNETIIHDYTENACDSQISMLAMLTYDNDARTMWTK